MLGKEERLRIAADIGDFAAVRELIDAGAVAAGWRGLTVRPTGVDLDACHKPSGQTALHYAAIKGHVSIATQLIEVFPDWISFWVNPGV